MPDHFIIPDTQVKPGVPTDHLRWIGSYIIDRRPDTIIHLGDHWDMPSLSHWDRGTVKMEGRRYIDDIESGNDAFSLITGPLRRHQARASRAGKDVYEPRLVLTLGNHEQRIERAVESDPKLVGALDYSDFATGGWEVYDYLKPVFIDGVGYTHVWVNPMTGKPLGGMLQTRLKNLGHSFTMGHQQTLDTAIRFIHGPDGPVQQRALVAGACYLHDEEYKGHQGNAHWRGVLVCHEVKDGGYDLMEVSLDFLCRKYEGVSLNEFLTSEYPNLKR